MVKICRNTGDSIITPCQRSGCIYFNVDQPLNCIYGEWSTPEELAGMLGIDSTSEASVKSLNRDAEIKITTWGKVLNSLDAIEQTSFDTYLKGVYRFDRELAGMIAGDLRRFVPPPMRYVKSFLWQGIVRKWKVELHEAGIASKSNWRVWQQLGNLNLL